MKQILITREQLTKITRDVYTDIAADIAVKQNDFMQGMILTIHTRYVINKVCDILFGKEESDAEKTGCKEDSHAED